MGKVQAPDQSRPMTVAELHRVCPIREPFVGPSEIEATIANIFP
jgi:hypothetical protein